VLTVEQEATIVAFRRHTLLPLDDCSYALQATIPGLTRSSLHCCLQRHGVSRLPDPEATPARKRFKAYPIGFVHIDLAEVRTEQGKLHLFVAIDRTSRFAFVQVHDRATRRIAADFLRAVAEAVPFKIHNCADRQRRAVRPQPAGPQHTRTGSRDRRILGRPQLATSSESSSSMRSTTPAPSSASSIGR
jgi:hypothetical protein